jgi:hypothetical protein
MECKLDDFTNLRQKAEDSYTISKQNKIEITNLQGFVQKICFALAGCAIAIIGFFIKLTLYK